MDVVEKVFLLQQIDLLKDARTVHLAALAAIADQIDVEAGHQLLSHGTIPSAMYVIVRGAVDIKNDREHMLQAGPGAAIGTWAMIDAAPSPMDAVAIEPTTLLRIYRDAFQDLLADQPELALGLLQGLARRVRALVA